MQNILRITSRGLLRIGGIDAEKFLQGLITKDINSVHVSGVIYAFLLNARGRIVSDLFIYRAIGINGFLLETDAQRITSLGRTLDIYRMRRKVEIEQMPHSIYFSSTPLQTDEFTNVFADPRLPTFGYRIINNETAKLSAMHKTNAFGSEDNYIRRRMEWGLAEGYNEVGDQIPLQMNGDLLNGISFEKGCYIGQELIARTHHAGIVRRRVLPFRIAQTSSLSSSSGDATNFAKLVGRTLVSDANDPAGDNNGNDVGKSRRQGRVLNVHGDRGIALVSLAYAGRFLLTEMGQRLEVFLPKWWPNKLI